MVRNLLTLKSRIKRRRAVVDILDGEGRISPRERLRFVKQLVLLKMNVDNVGEVFARKMSV